MNALPTSEYAPRILRNEYIVLNHREDVGKNTGHTYRRIAIVVGVGTRRIRVPLYTLGNIKINLIPEAKRKSAEY